MNYYFDTEFLEGTQSKRFLGIEFGKTKPTIDLISIGITSEDGREYYALSKEFNLKEAWNRFQWGYDHIFIKQRNGTLLPMRKKKKVYWIRENVLRPIYQYYLDYQQSNYEKTYHWGLTANFDYNTMQRIVNWVGKSNEQIAREVKQFVSDYKFNDIWEEGVRYDSEFGNGINNTYYFVKDGVKSDVITGTSKSTNKPAFYAYFADYDWVVFCWLFGKMNNLPNGFPYYCRDLKQIADEIWEKTGKNTHFQKSQNEHHALADAKWNKDFHDFLKTLE